MSEQRFDGIERSIDRLTYKVDSSEWFIRLLIASAVGFITYLARG